MRPIISAMKIRVRKHWPTIEYLAVGYIIVFCVSPILAQVDSSGLNLKAAISMALKADNTVKATQALYDASRNEIAKARADYYPRLALSGSYSHNSLINEMTLALPQPIGERKIQIAPENPMNIGLTLSGALSR